MESSSAATAVSCSSGTVNASRSYKVFDYPASAGLGLETSRQVEVTPVKAMEYMALRRPW